MKNLIKKVLIVSILSILFLPLGGCTRKSDINELSIATGIGIDKESESDDVIITIQVVNQITLARQPKEITPVVTLTERGKTVFEAFRKASVGFTGRVFLSHFQMLVFGEEAAKDDIIKYLNFFFNDHEAQHRFNIVICKEKKASEFLQTYSVFSSVPIIDYQSKLNSTVNLVGMGKLTNLPMALNALKGESNGLVLSSFEIKGDIEKSKEMDNIKTPTPEAMVWPSDLAVLKDGKLVTYLNYDESIGYNFANNAIVNIVASVEVDNRRIALEVRGSSCKKSIKIENGKPKVTFEVKVVAIVNSDMSGDTEVGKEYADKCKKALEENIKNRMNLCIKKAKEHQVDIFDIGTSLHRDRPKYWKTIKDDFENIFKEIEIDVKVNATIENVIH